MDRGVWWAKVHGAAKSCKTKGLNNNKIKHPVSILVKITKLTLKLCGNTKNLELPKEF